MKDAKMASEWLVGWIPRLGVAGVALGGCVIDVDDSGPNFGGDDSSELLGDGDGDGDGGGDGDGDGDGGGDGDGDGDASGDGDGDGDGNGLCGDGVTGPAEDCDDAGESPTCNADCTWAACGDGKLNVAAGEQCEGEVDLPNGSCDDACAFACDLDFGDCNGNMPLDGCETWLWMPADCGECGNACAAADSCLVGDCVATDTQGNDQEYPGQNVALAHNLLGNMLTVPEAAQLTHLSVYSKQAGPRIVMALYADEGGEPAQLVAQTPPVVAIVGKMEVPVGDPIDLAAGDYWLLGVFDVDASVGLDTSDASAVVKYIPFNFGSEIPAQMPPASTYTGQSLNYYINTLP